MCHNHCSFRPLLISSLSGKGPETREGERQERVNSLVDLSVELVESIVHSLNLGWYSVINSLSPEWPIVTGENLDIEID
jgi:hypothetical protein